MPILQTPLILSVCPSNSGLYAAFTKASLFTAPPLSTFKDLAHSFTLMASSSFNQAASNSIWFWFVPFCSHTAYTFFALSMTSCLATLAPLYKFLENPSCAKYIPLQAV